MCIKNPILIIVFTLIFSCSKNDTITILTDNKIIPFYINQFNIQNKASFIIKYKEHINIQTANEENAQVIISKNIDNINITKNFKNIKKYYYSDYPILNNISEKFAHKIVPLSFDVPILIYKNEYNIQKYIDIQNIKEIHKSFQKEKKIFISPYISENLFYTLSEINDINFYFGNNKPEYDDTKMSDMINHFKSFIDTNALVLHKNFAEKYKYLDLEKILLQKKTILIAGLTNLTYYNSLNKDTRDKINFSYLTNKGKKTSVCNINFMGVKEISKPIEKFIQWILNQEIQKSLIKFKDKTKFNEHFGFANGFTPYKSLNLKLKHIIKEIPSFIIDENYINKESYILNKKQIEKENHMLNELFLSHINNTEPK
ncbi:hypothetical protein [Borrelia hermsii]|uniref:Lipoprotein n=3 Tax=Borrelia hermsii TaxID=140 RepID=A0AAN0X5G8_BORHE|nr:hypothetical protein [Borrelia hermsii]AAX16865.1 hypothetical protein BH0352 [Borrelia hermsii DAH]AMR75484.1 hypothetical protein A0V01_02595 [Borrelia hermsii]ANA43164.1 hypothetical protein AXX13_01725 [Borrelia hermsii HS1]UPA07679.1 hypothetical protein bhDAH_000348 [Borrelia hermsii DAH]